MGVHGRNEDGGPWWLNAQWSYRRSWLHLKGWWTIGPKHTRNWAEVELAAGGEDHMIQFGVALPWLLRVYVGVGVPRRWLLRWVFERRELAARLQLPGEMTDGAVTIDVLRDEQMADLAEHYRLDRAVPTRRSCEHCGSPGYCHREHFQPSGDLLWWRFTPEPYTFNGKVIRQEPCVFGSVSRQAAEAFLVSPGKLESVDRPDPDTWTAIGTGQPRALGRSCPGFEPKPSSTTKLLEWPGWQLRIPLALRDWLLGPMAMHRVHLAPDGGVLVPGAGVDMRPDWELTSVGRAETRYGHHVGDENRRAPLALRHVMVPMPEGTYPAIVSLHRDEWKRPRALWRSRVVYRGEITPRQAIPEPGKGENSWDQGDTGTWAMSCPARSCEEAMATLVEDVLKRRERYGGPGWEPQGGWGDPTPLSPDPYEPVRDG